MADRVGVGILGCGVIGMFHSHSLRSLDYVRKKPGVEIDLVAVADIDEEARKECKARFGWAEDGEDWRPLVANPRIGLFINAAPNDLHAEPSIAAAQNGKHVFCEKPLGRTGDEAFGTWKAVAKAGVINQCGFVFRFIPAIRLMREMVRGGELDKVIHFRSNILMSTNLEPDQPMSWRMDKRVAGFGAIGDLGARLVDAARYIVGEIAEIASLCETAVPERDGRPVDVEDDFVAVAQFADGGIGIIEGSRAAAGYGSGIRVQVDGTKGSIRSKRRGGRPSSLSPRTGPAGPREDGPHQPDQGSALWPGRSRDQCQAAL